MQNITYSLSHKLLYICIRMCSSLRLWLDILISNNGLSLRQNSIVGFSTERSTFLLLLFHFGISELQSVIWHFPLDRDDNDSITKTVRLQTRNSSTHMDGNAKTLQATTRVFISWYCCQANWDFVPGRINQTSVLTHLSYTSWRIDILTAVVAPLSSPVLHFGSNNTTLVPCIFLPHLSL